MNEFYWRFIQNGEPVISRTQRFDSEQEAVDFIRTNALSLADSHITSATLFRSSPVRTVEMQRRVVLVGLDEPAAATEPDANPDPMRISEPVLIGRRGRKPSVVQPEPEPVQPAAPEPAVTELADVLSAAPEPATEPEQPEPDADTSDRVPRADVAPWEVIVNGCIVELRVGDTWSHRVYNSAGSADTIGARLSAHMSSGATGPASVAQQFLPGRAPIPEL